MPTHYQEDYYIDDMYGDCIDCPVCGGEGQLMGILGYLAHYRCKCCGIEFNQEIEHNQTALSGVKIA